ncbi:hypothetical protein E2320_006180 [Naja naja]|nr:hypothetical protein E2320_006180 [Naja naja]
MCVRIPRGPVQQPLEDRIFTPAVSAVYSTVTQVARQPGPPAPSPYPAHEINKGHPALAATPPGHASSPGLTQEGGGTEAFHPTQEPAVFLKIQGNWCKGFWDVGW